MKTLCKTIALRTKCVSGQKGSLPEGKEERNCLIVYFLSLFEVLSFVSILETLKQ